MGQWRRGHAIFLSAGVPDASKPHFLGEADVAAISAAISALLFVVLGRRPLVWGGHPAITPMVWAYAEALGIDYGKWVTLYQSTFFEEDFPEENAKFANVIITEAVWDDLDRSIQTMWMRIISDNLLNPVVFMGGVAGILDDDRIFSKYSLSSSIMAIMSTGGAAEKLGLRLDVASNFAQELDYVDLFYRKLDISTNEPRGGGPRMFEL